jgi:3D (Asp-Asp-Asp) domain-containing protein
MTMRLKSFLKEEGRKILIAVTSLSLFMGIFPVLERKVNAELGNPTISVSNLSVFQENSLASISNPANPDHATGRMQVVITAYSSTPEETDDTPFITAAGTAVRDGIVANNLLPFGTKIRIPDIYGDKVFVVEDRMNSKKGNYHFDIWFADKQEAKEFGIKTTYIEILEN